MDSDDRLANDPTGTTGPAIPTSPDAGRPRRRRSRWTWLLAILGLVVVVETGYLIYRALTDAPSPPPNSQVRVPDFVGRTLADARLIADAVGLDLVPTGRPSDQPISTILAQDPRSGTIVVQGSDVAVAIATGAETVTVPDLLGLPEANADALLAQVGLTVGTRSDAFDASVGVGSIAGQEPAAGTKASRGTPIDYVVSRGPAPLPSGSPSPTATTHPTASAPNDNSGRRIGDYRCLTLADATKRLTADGFVLGSVTYTFEGGPVDASWVVRTQVPAPGQRRPAGAKVDLLLTNPTFACRE
jgi:beta-lactam-binding protein with PASTA domain